LAVLTSAGTGDAGGIIGAIVDGVMEGVNIIDNGNKYNDKNQALNRAYNAFVGKASDWAKGAIRQLQDYFADERKKALTQGNSDRLRVMRLRLDDWKRAHGGSNAGFWDHYKQPPIQGLDALNAQQAVLGPQVQDLINATYATMLSNWRKASGHRLSPFTGYY